jgi:uncharacterized protein (DUF2252 family)
MSDNVGRLRFDHAPVPDAADRFEAGKAARSEMPRSAQGEYIPAANRDPLGILRIQCERSDAETARDRLERLARSPLAFSRGTAAIQAADLRSSPASGADVTLHGDAHLGTFGVYDSPERTLELDLAHFGDTAYGPWEWDLKRFVTSVVLTARDRGFKETKVQTATLEAAASYRIALRQLTQLTLLDRYYIHADVHSAQRDASSQRLLDRALGAASRRITVRTPQRLTRRADDGARVFVDDRPDFTRVSAKEERRLVAVLDAHGRSVPSDIAVLLSQYVPTDAVHRDDGIARPGRIRHLVVLSGPGGDHLVLEISRVAESSAVEFGGAAVHAPALDIPSGPGENGRRIVAGERMLQAIEDPFLGWAQHDGDSYVVRQFREPSANIDTERLDFRPFTDYVNACGTVLARAHSQSPAAPFIAGYTGDGTAFDAAIAEWASSYADQVADDQQALRKALKKAEL